MADTTTGQRAFSRGEESAHEESESLLSRAPSDRAHRPRTGVLWGANVAVEPEGDDASSLPEGRRTCIENLSMTVRVFFVRGLFVGRRWVFPLLLACTAASYEIAASTILGVIGDFYLAISSMDATLFVQVRGAREAHSIPVGTHPLWQRGCISIGLTVELPSRVSPPLLSINTKNLGEAPQPPC